MPQSRSYTIPQGRPSPGLAVETQPESMPVSRRGHIVYVIIINYHRADLTESAAQSALASLGVEVRIILIDNEADGALAGNLLIRDSRVNLISNAENLGFAAACNQGIERALAQNNCAGVLFLNNDAVLEPDALGMLKTAGAEYGMAAPKILLPDGRIWAAGGHVELARARCRNRGIYEMDHGQYDHAQQFQFASACALYVDSAALRKGRRFHEPYFLYYEDADFCLQLAREGYEVQYVPHARAVHLESASSNGHGAAQSLMYYNLRNRFLFIRRNAGPCRRAVGYFYLISLAMARGVKFVCVRQNGFAAATRMAMSDALRGRYGRNGL